jgi:hypothetical protein
MGMTLCWVGIGVVLLALVAIILLNVVKRGRDGDER